MADTALYYYLLPGVAVIHKDNGNILLADDLHSLSLEGEAANLFTETILPILDGETEFFSWAKTFPPHVAAGLHRAIEQITEAGFVKKYIHPIGQEVGYPLSSNLLNVFDQLQINTDAAVTALENARICIFGLEGHGALLPHLLNLSGIRNITLYDPFSLNKENQKTLPLHSVNGEKAVRQDVYADYYRRLLNPLNVKTGPPKLEKEDVMKAAKEHDILIGCFDKGFIAVNYWINEAATEYKKIAVYSELNGFTCRLGPTYLPDQTPCYMCYKIRNKANADDFDRSMLYEQFLSDTKNPQLHNRNVLPSSFYIMAGILSAEITKILTGITAPSLAGKVRDYDLLTLESESNKFLFRPDCPACQKKKLSHRKHYSLNELITTRSPPGNILSQKDTLLSKETGIIHQLEYLHKDPSEPYLPHVFRVRIANHNFLDKEEQKQSLYCSGKGFTVEEAHTSSLGEAAERYASARHSRHDVVYAKFNDQLDYEKLDPYKLVLYHPSQYPSITFAPYSHDNRIGWSLAYSLVRNKPLYVPSLSVFMNYQPLDEHEYFMQGSSSGLAGGATILEAIIAAGLEVIERDAFVLMWHAKLPCKKINIWSHPDKNVIKLCHAYKRRNVDLYLFRLSTDTPCTVYMSLGVEKGHAFPKSVIGLGADFNPAVAARQALLEVAQIRPALRQKCRQDEVQKRIKELVDDPHRTEKLEDHDLLFAHPSMYFAFTHMLEQSEEEENWMINYSLPTAEKLFCLVEHYKKNDGDFIYCNVSAPELEDLNLYAARVLIPDFQPIHFGAKNIRLGGKRLFELPFKMGFKPSPLSLADVEYLPHPLA